MSVSLLNPLQAFRFCPVCGADGLVRKDRNALQCPTCGFIYYLNPVSSVIAVINNESGEILLTRRKFEPHSGKLDLPGGFVDFNESLEEAIHREIKEELNISMETIRYFGSFPTDYEFKDLYYQPVDAVFVCTVNEWQGMKPADDVVEICFRSPHQLELDEIGFASHRHIIGLLPKPIC